MIRNLESFLYLNILKIQYYFNDNYHKLFLNMCPIGITGTERVNINQLITMSVYSYAYVYEQRQIKLAIVRMREEIS